MIILNEVLSDSDIANMMQMEINNAYTPAQREQLVDGRCTAAERADYDAFLALIADKKASMVAERDLLASCIAYERAILRLDEPLPDVPLTVDDGDGNMIANPVLVADTAEREASQGVIDAATPEILALAEQRAA